MSVRFVVEGAVYLLAAREALALARGLRLRLLEGDSPDALAAAVLLEYALSSERPRAIELMPGEARELLRLAGVRQQRPLYQALRRWLGRSGD